MRAAFIVRSGAWTHWNGLVSPAGRRRTARPEAGSAEPERAAPARFAQLGVHDSMLLKALC
jgi:hypothetical protein